MPAFVAVLTAAGIALAGCAQGTGDQQSDASFDPGARLQGELTVMGFGATDEIATVRLEEAETALGDVKVKLVEGDLDIQQFLSSVAAGDLPRSCTPTATRSARSPPGERSSR